MKNDRIINAFMLLMVLFVYSYPALRTLSDTGSHQLPPEHAADTSLYLSMSHLSSPSPGLILNPYYGVDVPTNSSGHLKFGLAFLLFSRIISLTGGHLWLSLFVWNLFWSGLLCVIAILVFERFLPDHSTELVALGLALLMFFNFGIVKSLLLAWLHPSWPHFEDLELAYIRPFFPQVAVPLLLAYVGLQIEWLQTKRRAFLVAMGLLQLAAFAMFPYTTLMMAGITATGASNEIFHRPRSAPYLSILSYAIACGAADVVFFFHGGGMHGQKQIPVVRLDSSALHHVIGGMWVLIGLLTLATAAARTIPAETKWSIVGLGLTNLALLTGDLLFSETALMVSHHAGYFAHATVAVLVTFLLAAVYQREHKRRPWMRPILSFVVLVLIVNGMLMAEATYRRFLPFNREQAELVSLLNVVLAGANDLLVVRAEGVDDACAWVPLVSPAKVLYCRNAAVLLTEEQNHELQRFRQALYLYLTGKDERQLDAIMHTPSLIAKQLQLAYFGGIAPFKDDERQRGLENVQTALFPWLERVEHHDAQTTDFFRSYAHVVVVDSRSHPVFDRERLSSYLTVQQERTWGEQSILICAAK